MYRLHFFYLIQRLHIMIKKLAIEFTNGVRREVALVGKSILFLGSDLEPVLLGSAENVDVSDETLELSSQAMEVNVRTQHLASVATLADGIYLGQRIAVKLNTLGTGGADELTLTSATGIVDASDSALTSLDFDAAGEVAILDWIGSGWRVVHSTATETA